MSRYSISGFIEKTSQRDLGQGIFELERDRLLEVNLNGAVWTKTGSMVAYLGEIKFKRERILDQGFGRGSGESLQMLLRGDGFVVIQPYEEVYMQHGR